MDELTVAVILSSATTVLTSRLRPDLDYQQKIAQQQSKSFQEENNFCKQHQCKQKAA
ncbi:hypothetical protein AAIB41_07670 [Brucella sp. BE17]|uniref:hypothetical protein n=1 Tax=Brucella sp. BE17 TaxID=3142977 RepID=UPI0031B9FB9C